MLKSNPRVSIIMPAYNVGLYIAEAIESVRSQTFTNWELIIIDDGSTDNTASIVSHFEDSRIFFFQQKKTRGSVMLGMSVCKI